MLKPCQSLIRMQTQQTLKDNIPTTKPPPGVAGSGLRDNYGRSSWKHSAKQKTTSLKCKNSRYRGRVQHFMRRLVAAVRIKCVLFKTPSHFFNGPSYIEDISPGKLEHPV